jgi:hypothetical protein
MPDRRHTSTKFLTFGREIFFVDFTFLCAPNQPYYLPTFICLIYGNVSDSSLEQIKINIKVLGNVGFACRQTPTA